MVSFPHSLCKVEWDGMGWLPLLTAYSSGSWTHRYFGSYKVEMKIMWEYFLRTTKNFLLSILNSETLFANVCY